MSIRQFLLQTGDRRRSERLEPEGLVAYYWTGAVPAPSKVSSIGVYGAMIMAPAGFYDGTVVEIVLEDGPLGRHICVYGKVLRNFEGGFCVEFVFGDSSDRRRLRQFLDKLKRKGGNATDLSTKAV